MYLIAQRTPGASVVPTVLFHLSWALWEPLGGSRARPSKAWQAPARSWVLLQVCWEASGGLQAEEKCDLTQVLRAPSGYEKMGTGNQGGGRAPKQFRWEIKWPS